jgi:hypothetical protein
VRVLTDLARTPRSLHSGLSGAAVDISSWRALVDLKLEDKRLHSINAALDLVRSEKLRSLQNEVSIGKNEDWGRLGVVLTRMYFAGLDVLRICYWSQDRHTPLPRALCKPLRRKPLIWKEHSRPVQVAS